jgi:hypothetical protein
MCISGIAPKNMPATTATKRVNSTTLPSNHAETEESTDGRDRYGLGEQLPAEPRAVGAQRDPGRQLTHPNVGAGQHQVRDIQAADQQDEQHTGPEHDECGPHVAEQIILQVVDLGVVASVLQDLPGIRDRKYLHQRVIEGLELTDRLLDGGTRSKPGDHLVVVVVESFRSAVLGLERDRHVEAALSLAEEAETLADHADDRVGPAVDAQVLSDDARVPAVTLPPEPVAEDHYLLAADVHLLLAEGASEQRLHPEQREE